MTSKQQLTFKELLMHDFTPGELRLIALGLVPVFMVFILISLIFGARLSLPSEPIPESKMIKKTIKPHDNAAWEHYIFPYAEYGGLKVAPWPKVDDEICKKKKSKITTEDRKRLYEESQPYQEYVEGQYNLSPNPSMKELIAVRSSYTVGKTPSAKYLIDLFAAVKFVESGKYNELGQPPEQITFIGKAKSVGETEWDKMKGKSCHYTSLAMGAYQYMTIRWSQWCLQIYGEVLLPTPLNQDIIILELFDNIARLYTSKKWNYRERDVARCMAQMWYSGWCVLEDIVHKKTCDVHRYELDYLIHMMDVSGYKMDFPTALGVQVRSCTKKWEKERAEKAKRKPNSKVWNRYLRR